jgi:hypothetical protein
MYQPSHATTEIGRMRAEEMRARAERYRMIQKAKQHRKAEPEEESLSRTRSVVYRRALGIAGLSVLMVLIFAGAALAMPADPPSGVGGNDEALVSQPQVREGPPSVWEAEENATTNIEPAPSVTSSSGGIELEMVLLLSGTIALASLGAFVWFRRHTINTA